MKLTFSQTFEKFQELNRDPSSDATANVLYRGKTWNIGGINAAGDVSLSTYPLGGQETLSVSDDTEEHPTTFTLRAVSYDEDSNPSLGDVIAEIK